MASQYQLLRSRRFLPFFATQALGAFNDNVFKNALVILIAFRIAGLSSAQVDLYANLAAGLFILPFFLFSAMAGQLAEKFEKSRQIRRIKLAEILIMAVGGVGFVTASVPLLFGTLFAMGLQSTFFGPLKYALLPQHLRRDELVGGNAWVEAGTFAAILTGTLVGGLLIAVGGRGPWFAAIGVVLVAIMGWLASRHIPAAPASAPALQLDFNPLTATVKTMRVLAGNRTVLNAVLGVSWFWFFGATFIAQLPNYTRVFLGGGEQVAPLVLALFSLGIGAGSLACERLSGRTIEIGLVPLGALGLTLFGIDLYFARPDPASVAGLSAMQFLQGAGNWRIALDLALIGVFGGFYIVPLYALIQSRAPADRVARVVAANNVLNAAFMVAAALLAVALLRAGLTIPELLLLTAVLNAVVAIYIFTLVPEFLLRFVSWILIRLLYRLRISGLEHVPDEGAALIASNHVGYLDALLIGGTVRRPIRFVMYYRIFRLPIVNWLFRAAKAIPIAGASEDPELKESAFAEVDRQLRDGELVGLFPEGRLSADGSIQPFRRGGLEQILVSRPVPVIPVALVGVWGSLFSRHHRVRGGLPMPRRLNARLELRFGEPIAPADASIARVEAAVRALHDAPAR